MCLQWTASGPTGVNGLRVAQNALSRGTESVTLPYLRTEEKTVMESHYSHKTAPMDSVYRVSQYTHTNITHLQLSLSSGWFEVLWRVNVTFRTRVITHNALQTHHVLTLWNGHTFSQVNSQKLWFLFVLIQKSHLHVCKKVIKIVINGFQNIKVCFYIIYVCVLGVFIFYMYMHTYIYAYI